MDSTTNKRKETNINSGVVVEFFLPPSERGPSAPVPSIVHENWAGVDIMYYSDGRWRRQSLGSARKTHPRMSRAIAFRAARGYVPRAATLKYLVAAND